MHEGIHVVRDDLYPGGTKARYIGELFDGADVVVYASPCEGGAQTALAHVAQRLGKRVVIVCAKRRVRHPRTVAAVELGAELFEVSVMPRLNVIQARAKELATANGWKLAPFGLQTPNSSRALSEAARSTGLEPDEVWSVGSSGVLALGLAEAWPDARRHTVQVGHTPNPADVGFATMHVYGKRLSDELVCSDFPSDRHYDAKAWDICRKLRGDGVVVFWNVTGPAEDALNAVTV